MQSKIHQNNGYRNDIDGLRTIAVIAVFIFHAGYLPNGFLGVDIFFVISGYLITRILYVGVLDSSFSILEFYIKRLRRIIPLVLFFCLLSLIIGVVVMLPDDLDNLSQSTIASIFFSNNILLCVTTKNYWAAANEFKPLLHTWSLGIEEQFYILYPLFFSFFLRKRKLIFLLLLFITVLSAYSYFQTNDTAYLFYLLPNRFFEFSIGGLAAILLVYRQIQFRFKFIFLLFTFYLLAIGLPIEYLKFQIPLICITTILLLITSDENSFCDNFLQRRVITGIGKISFSVYMWHQFLLGFTRYFIIPEINITTSFIIFTITIVLSIATYFIIETPFRNKQIINNTMLFASVITTTCIVLGVSLFIYFRAGVLKEFPELNISISNYERNIQLNYIIEVDKSNGSFSNSKKTNVLVYGNSFARDWTNVLRESIYKDRINVICVSNIKEHMDLAEEADIIFLARLSKISLPSMSKDEIKYLDNSIKDKIWCVGTKNFGISNGIFYNYYGDGYCLQRTKMKKGYLEENNKLKEEWNTKYVDIIGLLSNGTNTVPVFTPNCKFISQDTYHLTQPGAEFIASIVQTRLQEIIK